MAITGSPTLTASSFCLSLTSMVMVRLGPFSVTVPLSLSTASTVPRTFTVLATALPGIFAAGAFSAVPPDFSLVPVAWASRVASAQRLGASPKRTPLTTTVAITLRMTPSLWPIGRYLGFSFPRRVNDAI